MKWQRLIPIIFAIFLFSNILISFNVKACKDIVACGDATAGDYNLLMKVRDPSRPGLQVLCIVPEGYEYNYHHPWTGKPMNFKVQNKMIGVCSKGDTIPNIVKAGMSLSDSGISYGNADSNSRWTNPTKNAWDDFDWIRFACEKAITEDEAVDFLTKEAVKKMHATGVSENLFVVGPKKGYVIEADAFRYKVKEINNGIDVMSNYPRELWKTQILNTLPISRSFDNVIEKYVRNKQSVRLKSLYGVRIVEIGDNFISVIPISAVHALKFNSFNVITKINLGERKTVGYFSVELLDIDGNKAKVRVTNVYKAWEEKMLEYIQPHYGSITIKDMIEWSRFDMEDLDGLRPMCEDTRKYETVAIYKIPEKNYEILSSGWFSPNRACSSIYVPFHICNNEIYEPYKTGEAAQVSLDLFDTYDHKSLAENFSKIENVFLNDIEFLEKISNDLISDDVDVSDFLTIIDMGMQKQAFLTEEMWLDAGKISTQNSKQKIISVIGTLWNTSFTHSLDEMKNALFDLEEITGSTSFGKRIIDIAQDICKSRIDAADSIGKQSSIANDYYEKGVKHFEQDDYELGFENLKKSFTISDRLIKGQTPLIIESIDIEENKKNRIPFYLSILLLLIGFILVLSRLRLVFKSTNKN